MGFNVQIIFGNFIVYQTPGFWNLNSKVKFHSSAYKTKGGLLMAFSIIVPIYTLRNTCSMYRKRVSAAVHGL